MLAFTKLGTVVQVMNLAPIRCKMSCWRYVSHNQCSIKTAGKRITAEKY